MPKREGAPQPEAENKQPNKHLEADQYIVEAGRLDVPVTVQETRHYQEINESRAKAKAYEAKLQSSLDERKAQEEYVKQMRAMYPDWDKFNNVSLAELNANREQLQARAEVAKEVVNGTEQIVNEVVRGPELVAQVNQALAKGAVTAEQAAQMRAALQNEQARQQIVTKTITWKDRASNFKDWVVDRAPAFIAGAVAGGAARKAVKLGAIAAFGANLPVAIAAGALGGGLVEGIKTAWRESKSYRARDIMGRFYGAGELDKAAMLGKIEQLHAEQRLEMSPEEYEVIGRVLAHTRTQMQLSVEGRDGRYANFTDRDKIAYILHITDKNRRDVMKLEDKHRMKESKALVKTLNKELDKKFDRKWMDVAKNKKAIVGKAIFKGAAFGALGGTVGAALVDYLSGPSSETVSRVVEHKPVVDDSFHVHLDHRGLTGGARDSLHTFIEQQRGVDPNFAQGVTVEQLVYAEDTLAKDALKAGVKPGAESYTWSKDELMNAVEKSGAIPGDGKLTEAGQANISELIQTKAHFLSEATKAKMLDFNPEEAKTFIEQVVVEKQDHYSYEDYVALAGVLAAIAASEALSYSDRDKAASKLRTLQRNVPELRMPPAGASGLAPDGPRRGPAGSKANERFPGGTPPSPFTHPEGVQNVGDEPIPKPEGTPFDQPANVEDRPIAKPEGEIFEDEIFAGEQDEQELTAAEITPDRMNQKLRGAGVRAEVKPWPEDKATAKHKQKIAKLVDEYIAYAPELEDLAIAGQIVLDFQPRGKQKARHVEGDIIVEVPLELKRGVKGYFQGLDREIRALLPEAPAADQLETSEPYLEAGDKEEQAALEKQNLYTKILVKEGFNAKLEYDSKRKLTGRERDKIEKFVSQFIQYAQKIKGLDFPDKIVLNIRTKDRSTENIFFDKDVFGNDEIVLALPLNKQYKPEEFGQLIDRILKMKIDQMVGQINTGKGTGKVDVSRNKNKRTVSLIERYKSAMKLWRAYQQKNRLSQTNQLEFTNQAGGPDNRQLGPKSELIEAEAVHEHLNYPNISVDAGYNNIAPEKRRAAEELLDNIIKTELKEGLNPDITIILSDGYKVGEKKFSINMSRPDRASLSGQLHSGLRIASRITASELSPLASTRNMREEWAEQNDANTSERKNVEKFADNAIKELFDTDVNLVDLSIGREGWLQWIDEQRSALGNIFPKKISNSQRKNIESYMGKKKVAIDDLVKTKSVPGITGVPPDAVKRFIAEAALDKLQALIDDPRDRDEEFTNLRNRTEEFIERSKQ